MKRHRTLLTIVALATLFTVAAVAQTPAGKGGAKTAPAAVVTALYKDHFSRRQNIADTFKRNRARFTPELLALIDESDRKQAANPDEIVGLDFDALTNAQEDARSYKVTTTTREGADAIVTVEVRFVADPKVEPTIVRLRLSPAGSTWKVSNVLYDEGDLVGILKEG